MKEAMVGIFFLLHFLFPKTEKDINRVVIDIFCHVIGTSASSDYHLSQELPLEIPKPPMKALSKLCRQA